MARLFASTALSVLLAGLASVGASANPLQWVVGEWGVEPDPDAVDDAEVAELRRQMRCGGSQTLFIDIDGDALRFLSRRGEEVTEGDISAIQPSAFAVAYDDETRIMANGEPHLWHAVFIDPDSFVWVLDEWMTPYGPKGSTLPRVRCKGASS